MSAAVKVYLSLGSNISPETNLAAALVALERVFGGVLAHSSAWQSASVGTVGPDFLNAAVLVYSDLSTQQIKGDMLRPLEAQMGRVRTADKNAPRTIDIDVLLYGDRVVEDTLWRQAHLAVPLAEIFPDLRNPQTDMVLEEVAEILFSVNELTRREDVLAARLPK